MNDSFQLKRLQDGQIYPIDRPSMLVGRGGSCQIPASEGFPSREHARIIRRSEGLFVEDLQSTNGTYVNNRRISEVVKLRSGDVIKIGDEGYLVVTETDPDSTVISTKLAPALSQLGSTVVCAEADDPDGTSVQQRFPLPASWTAQDRAQFEGGNSSHPAIHRGALDQKILAALSGASELYSAAIVVMSGNRPASVHGLSLEKHGKQWTIGRKADADVLIDDPSISELHAVLRYDNGQWWLKDNQSTNGMRQNGRPCQDIRLEDLMRVRLGRVEVVFRVLGFVG
ncbi:FHA domain-containing protein [Mangrovitalea sediminis]|uniref:FHA domain-containing protein n=1 Tax=Mangrovitalea sediminis TaxID=1982043 RepID=UPI000BE55D1F|nr:FHA domain-containing protein [Mangrovitalea sediminis]